MSDEVPFPARQSPPPLYEDVFSAENGDGEGEDINWNEDVDPQLFTSSNLFSAEQDPSSTTSQQETAPGGLLFPDLPTPVDLFGPETNATAASESGPPSSTTDATSPVSWATWLATATSVCCVWCPKSVSARVILWLDFKR